MNNVLLSFIELFHSEIWQESGVLVGWEIITKTKETKTDAFFYLLVQN